MDLAPAAARRPLNIQSPREITINGETYDIPTRQASAVTEAIVRTWELLGKPEDMFSEAGKKVMDVIFATWQDTFPKESAQWIEDRKEYQDAEHSISYQVRHETGRSLASYPYYIYQVMKIVFPNVKYAERDTVLKLVKYYPLFRMANKA